MQTDRQTDRQRQSYRQTDRGRCHKAFFTVRNSGFLVFYSG